MRKINFSFQYIPSNANPVDIITEGLQIAPVEYQLTDECEEKIKSEEQIVAKVSKLFTQTVEEAQFSFVDGNPQIFVKQTTKKKIAWLQSMLVVGKRLTSEDFKLAEWVLIRQAQYEGINEEGKEKWNICRNDQKLWRSKS
ncbi:hypothetical protein DINM_005847 [Dirofilaria immitis]|nr:hypothetical protein [Dirofilaria immitis]